MTVVEYLSQIHFIEKKIEQLTIRAAEFERLSFSVPSISFDRDRVESSRNLDAPFVKWLEKKDIVDDEINELKLKVESLKSEIYSQIDKINNDQCKNILVMRYLNRLSWEQIAKEMYMSLSTVKRLHKTSLGLLKIQKNNV